MFRGWISLFLRAGLQRSVLAGLVLLALSHSAFAAARVHTHARHQISLKYDHALTSGQIDGSVVELVPPQYRKRYLNWKAEYLSTEAGRKQWQAYVQLSNFTLFIVMSKELEHSAEAGDYIWDAAGRLVAATILLGPKINSGYPSTSNYPIMCSLAPSNLPHDVKGELLAAAKLAHEFGHVNYTATQDAALYRLQNELIPEYNRIFKLTHFHFEDARLVELSRLMKGTPPEISQAREYQAEANVASYLKERFSGKGEYKIMPQPIKEAIESYYQGFSKLQ
jgi:hypothetical protein